MPYDLRIVCTDDWLNAANDPITKQDAYDLIASDPELASSTEDCIEMHEKRAEGFFQIWSAETRLRFRILGAGESRATAYLEVACDQHWYKPLLDFWMRRSTVMRMSSDSASRSIQKP